MLATCNPAPSNAVEKRAVLGVLTDAVIRGPGPSGVSSGPPIAAGGDLEVFSDLEIFLQGKIGDFSSLAPGQVRKSPPPPQSLGQNS